MCYSKGITWNLPSPGGKERVTWDNYVPNHCVGGIMLRALIAALVLGALLSVGTGPSIATSDTAWFDGGFGRIYYIE